MTRTNLHTGFGVGSGLRTLSLLDLSGHSQEGLLNVGGVLSRSFEERDSKAISEFLEYLLAEPAGERSIPKLDV